MNKFIKPDLEQAVSFMKIAIMNALYDIETEEESKIELIPYISWAAFVDCLEKADCSQKTFDYISEDKFESYWTTNKKKLIKITGSFWSNKINYIIEWIR